MKFPVIQNSYKSELCNMECSDGKKRIGYYTSDGVWYESGKFCDFALDIEVLTWQYLNAKNDTENIDDFNWDEDGDGEVEEILDKKGRKKGNFKGITMVSAEEGKKYIFNSIVKCDDPNCQKCKRKAIIQKVVTKKG